MEDDKTIVSGDSRAYSRDIARLLRHMMIRNGFEPIDCEWWHFTLRDEPYPDTYFEFSVSSVYLKR